MDCLIPLNSLLCVLVRFLLVRFLLVRLLLVRLLLFRFELFLLRNMSRD